MMGLLMADAAVVEIVHFAFVTAGAIVMIMVMLLLVVLMV